MRVRNQVAFFLLLVFVGLVGSGCILFDSNRLKNFKGPSWDVPITIPVISTTTAVLKDVLDMPDDDGDLGVKLEIDTFDAFVSPMSGDVPLPPVSDVAEDTLDLGVLADLPEFRFVETVLELNIRDDMGIHGELELVLTAIKDGHSLHHQHERFTLSGEANRVIAINLTDLLNLHPDTVHVKRTVCFNSQTIEATKGDKLSIQSSLRVPFIFEIPQEGIKVELDIAELTLDEDTRATLHDSPVSGVELVFDVENGFPFGFRFGVTFSNDPSVSEDVGSIKKELSVSPAPLDGDGRSSGKSVEAVSFEADRELLDMLAREPLYAKYEIVIPPGEASQKKIRFQGQNELSFSAHAIFTVGINKHGSK